MNSFTELLLRCVSKMPKTAAPRKPPKKVIPGEKSAYVQAVLKWIEGNNTEFPLDIDVTTQLEISCFPSNAENIDIYAKPPKKLERISGLPKKLIKLGIHDAIHLKELPPLNEGLLVLEVTGTKLTKLGPLPSTLHWLECAKNKLTELPPLPDGLENLFCDHNLLKELPRIPNSVREIVCDKTVKIPQGFMVKSDEDDTVTLKRIPHWESSFDIREGGQNRIPIEALADDKFPLALQPRFDVRTMWKDALRFPKAATAGTLIPEMTKESMLCPMFMDHTVQFEKLLSPGDVSGMNIWKVIIDGYSFAAKINLVDTDEIINTSAKDVTLLEIATAVEKVYPQKYAKAIIISYNGGNESRVIHPNETIYIPKYIHNINLTQDYPITRSGVLIYTIPKGSMMFLGDEQYLEFMIGMQCTRCKISGVAANVLSVFDFASCTKDARLGRQFNIMELATYGDYKKLVMSGGQYDPIAVLAQIIITLEGLQRSFKFVHGDMHYANIFMSRIKDVSFRGVPLAGKLLHYHIDNEGFILPRQEVFPLISDFGWSSRFREPMMLSDKIFDQHSVPNFFSAMYDVLYFLFRGALLYRMKEYVDIVEWILNLPYNPMQTVDQRITNVMQLFSSYYTVIDETGHNTLRPSRAWCLEMRGRGETPKAILKHPHFDKYRSKSRAEEESAVTVCYVTPRLDDPLVEMA